MHDDRLALFSRQRLDGHDIPADLRIILVSHWDGDTEMMDVIPVEFLETGQPHPLRDHSYLNETERADPEMQAVMAASERMAEHVKLVAKGGKGWLGYWFHPDQPTHEPPPPIELDTEGQFWSMDGTNFAEACIADDAECADDPAAHYADLADRLIARGVPISTRVYDELACLAFAIDPNTLDNKLTEAARGSRRLT